MQIAYAKAAANSAFPVDGGFRHEQEVIEGKAIRQFHLCTHDIKTSAASWSRSRRVQALRRNPRWHVSLCNCAKHIRSGDGPMKILRRQFLHLAGGALALPAVSRCAWA